MKFLKYALALALGGALFWAFNVLAENNNWVGVSALATLLLIFAAFLMIQEFNTKEKLRRRDEILKEISDWAEKGFGFFATSRRDTTLEIIKENRAQLAPIKAKDTAINQLAKTFDKEFQAKVEKAIANLDEYFYYFDSGRDKAKSLNIETLPKKCADAFVDVLKTAARLRASETK